MTEIYVGTSGWVYDWNPDGLEWYVVASGLNAVELNASFYRFPRSSAVLKWARLGSRLRWAIKVHRGITHSRRLAASAVDLWNKLRSLFEPMEGLIEFYLFQMPPTFSAKPENVERIEGFVAECGLKRRMALEFRHSTWFSRGWEKWASELGITLVSVDAPDLPRDIYNTSGDVYLRMHGRTWWYTHRYTEEELREVARRVLDASPERVFVFFNNDHDMLENGREMLALLRELTRR